MKHIISVLSVFLLSNSSAFAYEGPAPLKNVKVVLSTTFDSVSGLYTYTYKVTNPTTNDGKISNINIFISQNPNVDSSLSGEGLTHCAHFGKSSLYTLFQKRPMVPVGSKAPDNWRCSYATLADYKDGSYMWGAREKGMILPGTSLGGFELTSYGLPGIRDIVIEPDVDLERLPPEYYENIEKTVALENKVKWTGKTVGPKAPPKTFNALDFINYLISLKDQSFTMGWIDNQGINNSFSSKLDQVKSKIQSNDMKTAKNVTDAFLQELQAQNGKHLTSEAFSLLYYNGKYLSDRLK